MKELIVKPIESTRFGADCLKAINVNGKKMALGYWNLLCNIRDLSMYAKRIIPNGFNFNVLKEYYGVEQGGIIQVKEYLEQIYEQLTNKKYWEDKK